MFRRNISNSGVKSGRRPEFLRKLEFWNRAGTKSWYFLINTKNLGIFSFLVLGLVLVSENPSIPRNRNWPKICENGIILIKLSLFGGGQSVRLGYFRWKMSKTAQNVLFSVHRAYKLTLFYSWTSQKVLKSRKLAFLGILGFLGISWKTILGIEIGIEFLVFLLVSSPTRGWRVLDVPSSLIRVNYHHIYH